MRHHEVEAFHARVIALTGEPDHLRRLRQQAERIEEDRRRQVERMFQEQEANRLREEIRRAGHTPVA